jgi:hypothetical protein
MATKKRKPEVTITTHRYKHPNAERIEITILGANAKIRGDISELIREVIRTRFPATEEEVRK